MATESAARWVGRYIVGIWRALTWALVGSRPGVEYEMALLRGVARGGDGQGGRCDD